MKIFVITLLCSIVLCWGQEPFEPLLPEGGLVEKEDELVRCKHLLCDEPCIYGSVLAADGCLTCNCKTPDMLCEELACSEGQRCHFPTCSGELCATMKPMCLNDCVMSPMCANSCDYGYAKDEHGCMVNCDCNSAPEFPPMAIDPVPELLPGDFPGLPPRPIGGCSAARCRMFCEFGFQKDDEGCEICICRLEPEHCSEASCLLYCQYGFEKDERGCDMCKCRRQPVACPNVMCTMFCEGGFQKNELGCDICRCNPDGLKPDVCSAITCPEGQTCRAVPLMECNGCSPVPTCKPMSICELHQGQVLNDTEKDMIFQHLSESEKDRFFPGPAMCKPGGAFEPRQCSGSECFCVDDRGVKQDMMESSEEEEECAERITNIVNLTFQLEHDIEDNDLEGAFNDIQELVRETVGKLMTIDKDSIIQVDVVYLRPGILVVQMQVIRDGMTDLAGATHHLHKKMNDGDCDLQYNEHMLKPKPETALFKHQYEPVPEPEMITCWDTIRHMNPLMIALPFFILALIIVIVIIAVVARKRRSASYQFAHKKMENMDTFKRNLILSSEWEKPDLMCKDDVKVIFSDEIEKKPLA